jgi:hypothetical protein
LALTGALKKVAEHKCPHCEKDYGRHSKKQFLRCLYTSDYHLYDLIQKYNELQAKHNELTKKENDDNGGEKEEEN